MPKKSNRGGKREGSGSKPKYGEETKSIAFRCPISKIPELTAIIKDKLTRLNLLFFQARIPIHNTALGSIIH